MKWGEDNPFTNCRDLLYNRARKEGVFMAIQIQKAVPADAEAILAYLKQVGGETDNLSFGAEGMNFTVEQEQAYIASMENSADDVMLLAKEEGKVLGVATLSRLPRRMGHRGDFGISVCKAYWGRGIGTLLLEGILAFAKANGFEVIDLQVRSDNHRAISLYEKFGFRQLCRYPGFCKIGDNAIDYLLMYLPLI